MVVHSFAVNDVGGASEDGLLNTAALTYNENQEITPIYDADAFRILLEYNQSGMKKMKVYLKWYCNR